FQNAILILTSNLGAAERRAPIGLAESSSARDEHAYYQRHVEATFRPELVNRLDRVVVFHALTPDQIREVTRIAIDKIRARTGLVDLGLSVEVSDAAMDRLARDGYSAVYGARALRRHLEENLVAAIAKMIGRHGGEASDAQVIVDLERDDGPLRFTLR